ncbi:alpha/beta fold hydrolase [Subtercola endophyticus]|uniref:alpha/beta fold hydrolase n=1 Tax=Subtercola endophyticus TaxID=2895559 RepID=UPI001E44DED4|nr:alpha/beta hydrolase [Subtercola endophyticus]UFS58502.1 alpha/beta hydrolase [Subtercola endophyticus]
MNVILVPGFWLGAWSWSPVSAALVDAGHSVHALTLPGLESADADRSGITLADQVAAVVAAIDAVGTGGHPAADTFDHDGSVDRTAADIVLVGHSGGGPISYAAADQRPTRIARIVYVDSGPLAAGLAINPNIPEVGGEMPLPAWEFFDPDELVGLTPKLLEEFRANAIAEPSRVSKDLQAVSDPRRFDIPSTVITCTLTAAQLNDYAEQGAPFLAELTKLNALTVVELLTGHWPQFSRPDELAEAVVAAVAATA